MGTIHGILAADVHPNQNIDIGRRIPPTIATGRRFSGMKSSKIDDWSEGIVEG